MRLRFDYRIDNKFNNPYIKNGQWLLAVRFYGRCSITNNEDYIVADLKDIRVDITRGTITIFGNINYAIKVEYEKTYRSFGT